ncbi:MAG: CopD family protein [Porticoccaceae bacterium]|nr:CopD family protein [Porticoccaceae bacterium]
MYDLIILLHVLAATVWTGGHLVLALTILPAVLKNRDLAFIQTFESCYEKIGIPALLIQIATGLWLVNRMVADHSALLNLDNPVARLLWIKLGLLGLTAVLAADARLRIIPKLSPANLKSLAFHIVPVTIIAVLFVVTGVLFRFGWLN